MLATAIKKDMNNPLVQPYLNKKPVKLRTLTTDSSAGKLLYTKQGIHVISISDKEVGRGTVYAVNDHSLKQ